MGRPKRAIRSAAKESQETTASENTMQDSDKLEEEVRFNHPHPVGLKNLGNTCFYNSVVQCLCQTDVLFNMLKDEKRKSECVTMRVLKPSAEGVPTLEYEVPPMSALLLSTFNLLNKVYTVSSASNDDNNNRHANKATRKKHNSNNNNNMPTINPSDLFNEVCSKSGRFSAMEQDDCLAFFDTLLILSNEEDKKAQKGAVLKTMKLAKARRDDVSEETRARVRAYGQEIEANHVSPMDRVFSGKYISHLRCDGCQMMKRCEERFHTLALSVTDLNNGSNLQTTQQKNSKNNKPKTIEVEKSSGKTTAAAESPRSKYQEKKAKKQARREAKYQKRHIKFINLKQQQQQATPAPEDSKNDSEEQQPQQETSFKSTTVTTSEDAAAGDAAAHAEKAKEGEGAGADATPSGDAAALPGADEAPSGGEGDDESVISNRFASLNIEGKEEDEVAADDLELKGGDGTMVNNNKTDNSNSTTTQDVDDNGNTVNDKQQSNDENNNNDDDGENESKLENGKSSETTKSDGGGGGDDWFASPSANRQAAAANAKLKMEKCELPDVRQYEMKSNKECSVKLALHKFTSVEYLREDNCTVCETCTKKWRQQHPDDEDGSKHEVRESHMKQILISEPPPVLVLQMKIFTLTGRGTRKMSKHVELSPLLDIAPYCIPHTQVYADNQNRILYELFAVIVHQGTMNSGHYTCYVKRRATNSKLSQQVLAHQQHTPSYKTGEGHVTSASYGKWYHVSDHQVTAVSESKVLNSNAYVVFYERVV